MRSFSESVRQPCGDLRLLEVRRAGEHRLEHRAQPGTRRIAVSGVLDKPAIILNRRNDVRDSGVRFLRDEEFNLARVRRTQAAQEPALRNTKSDPVVIPVERQACFACMPSTQIGNRRYVAIVTGAHQHHW